LPAEKGSGNKRGKDCKGDPNGEGADTIGPLLATSLGVAREEMHPFIRDADDRRTHPAKGGGDLQFLGTVTRFDVLKFRKNGVLSGILCAGRAKKRGERSRNGASLHMVNTQNSLHGGLRKRT